MFRAALTSAFARCPHCKGHIPLTTVGLDWAIRSPRDVADRLTITLGRLEREELHVLLLNAKNRVMRDVTVYVGNVSASLVRIAELFTEAIRENASGVILVHNHPSGDPTPSPDDLHLTAEALAAGRLLDIDVLDHIVIGGDGWVSLRDRGVTFDRVTRSAEEGATYDGDTITLEPDWEVMCEWFARALSEHAFERFATAPVVSFIEQVRYLTLTDPDAVVRVIDRVTRR